MAKNIVTVIFGLLLGIGAGYVIVTFTNNALPLQPLPTGESVKKIASGKEVLGFLPYWLLDKARPDYGGYITTLDYFSLTVDKDGTIMKSTSPVELEPGYYALMGGKLDAFFETARARNIKLALTVFSGDQDNINQLVSDPVTSADNLVNDLAPIIGQYGFKEINLDVEPIGTASPAAQVNYEKFVARVRDQIDAKNLGTILSMDIIPVDFIRSDHMAIPARLAKYLDKIIIMAYDFHSPSSFVTGPVAPIYGAGTINEFDTQVSLNAALTTYDPAKILLGVPSYGYSWETIDNFARAAIVPSSAIIESNKDVEDFLSSCATCSAQFDDVAQEKYVIYKNADSGTYQQIFYPDEKGMNSKIDFVRGNNLGGVAIWALGYEGDSILNPIGNYLR